MIAAELLHSHVFHSAHLQNFPVRHKTHDVDRQNDGVHIYFRPNSSLKFHKMEAGISKKLDKIE